MIFDRAGHYSSPYIVALAAGLAPSDAADLAKWSQYPDDDARYTATEGLFRNSPFFSHDLQTYAHSLRGTDACVVRASLLELFPIMTEPWARGFLVHALGDAYAHTRDCKAHAVPCCKPLYGWPLGHGFRGHAPDLISYNPKRYMQYVRALYSAVAQSHTPKPVKPPQPEILDELERCVTADDFPKDIDDEMCALNCFVWKHGLVTRQYEPTF
jgi:hypothetical protein